MLTGSCAGWPAAVFCHQSARSPRLVQLRAALLVTDRFPAGGRNQNRPSLFLVVFQAEVSKIRSKHLTDLSVRRAYVIGREHNRNE